MKKILLLGSALVLSQSVNAVVIPNGYYTSNDFRQLDAATQAVYAAGVVDGASTAPMFAAAGEVRLQLFMNCIGALKLTSVALAELTRREIDSDPAMWGYGANMAVWKALRKACIAHGYTVDTKQP